MVYLDGDGDPLDGANRYELRFDREPAGPAKSLSTPLWRAHLG
jgi:hypothetical protein